MNHFVVMEVDQPRGDTGQLEDFRLLTKRGNRISKERTYKSEPVDLRMCLDELIDVSIYHPL